MYNTGTEIQDRKIQTTNKIQKTEIQRYRFAVNSQIAKVYSTHRDTKWSHRIQTSRFTVQVYIYNFTARVTQLRGHNHRAITEQIQNRYRDNTD